MIDWSSAGSGARLWAAGSSLRPPRHCWDRLLWATGQFIIFVFVFVYFAHLNIVETDYSGLLPNNRTLVHPLTIFSFHPLTVYLLCSTPMRSLWAGGSTPRSRSRSKLASREVRLVYIVAIPNTQYQYPIPMLNTHAKYQYKYQYPNKSIIKVIESWSNLELREDQSRILIQDWDLGSIPADMWMVLRFWTPHISPSWSTLRMNPILW